MSLSRLLAGITVVMAGCFLWPVFGQSPVPPDAPKPAKLPLTRVVLFNAGVGYFHREGIVDGNARVDLKVAEEDVNDLIKSLIATDKDGGTARAITYDNHAPAEITLKAFAIDLTENPTIGQLLQQVRGEKIEVTDLKGTQLVGQIVSVERSQPDVASPKIVEQVNLLTEDGVQSVPLSQMKKLKFQKIELQSEFKLALEALAAARGEAKKSVAVTFAGNGKRRVSVGYVAEAALWKPTYRVNLTGDTARVQGWASVENTTDDDWDNVKITLVSGRPMTFKMDLYEPLFVPRPTIEPEIFASLRPPVYQGGVGQQSLPAQFGGAQLQNGSVVDPTPTAMGQQGGGQLGAGGFAGGQGGFGGGLGGKYGPNPGTGLTGGVNGLSRPSIRSLTRRGVGYDQYVSGEINRLESLGGVAIGHNPLDTKNLGEPFQYAITDPVSLPRFKSALVPVVNEPAEVQRLSLYNPAVLQKHPLLGVRLTNKSKLFLAQGPVAVYDGDTFAGDSRLADVKPGESRLLSYAIDLTTDIKADTHESKSDIVGVKITNGNLVVKRVNRDTIRYTAVNRDTTPRTVWITQTLRKNWNLITPAKPVERTAELQRFELKVPANDAAKLDVTEEETATETTELGKFSSSALDEHVKRAVTPATVKAAITRLIAERAKLNGLEASLKEESVALKAIADEQTRIRANMERVPKDSLAYQRYLKKFDDQETEIERRQAKAATLLIDGKKQEKALAELTKTMNAD